MNDNQALDQMRKSHEPLGLSADEALAWHEFGHALAAALSNRLREVTMNPCSSRLGGETSFERNFIEFDTDLLICAMGSVAQMTYIRLHQKTEPSSFFIDQYVDHAARVDHVKLLHYWPNKEIGEESFLELIHELSRQLQRIDSIRSLLEFGARTLMTKRHLSNDEVQSMLAEYRPALTILTNEARRHCRSLSTTPPDAP